MQDYYVLCLWNKPWRCSTSLGSSMWRAVVHHELGRYHKFQFLKLVTYVRINSDLRWQLLVSGDLLIVSRSCFALCGHHLSPRIVIVFSLLKLWCTEFLHVTFVYFPHLLTHPVLLLVHFTFSQVWVLLSFALPQGHICASSSSSRLRILVYEVSLVSGRSSGAGHTTTKYIFSENKWRFKNFVQRSHTTLWFVFHPDVFKAVVFSFCRVSSKSVFIYATPRRSLFLVSTWPRVPFFCFSPFFALKFLSLLF